MTRHVHEISVEEDEKSFSASIFKEMQSQTVTKMDSQDISLKSNKTEHAVREALSQPNVLNFEYLTSSKVYNPKHLPIEDKGKVYYYQDDPLLYKKIKK